MQRSDAINPGDVREAALLQVTFLSLLQTPSKPPFQAPSLSVSPRLSPLPRRCPGFPGLFGAGSDDGAGPFGCGSRGCEVVDRHVKGPTEQDHDTTAIHAINTVQTPQKQKENIRTSQASGTLWVRPYVW